MERKIRYWNEPSLLPEMIRLLKRGEVLLVNTDTVLGLVAIPSGKTVAQLNALKHREGKPYLIQSDSICTVLNYVDRAQVPHIEKMMNRCWRGPVTLILPAESNVPDYMKSPHNSIAFRIPDHAGLQELLQHIPLLFSTSANIAGEPIPATIDDVNKTIIDAVPLIVLDREDSQEKSIPSTILDCTGDTIKVVRQGDFRL